MKKILLLVLLAITHFTASSQVQFWSDDFENATAPSSGTRTPSYNGGSGATPYVAYFLRTQGNNIDLSFVSDGPYSNVQGSWFWAGEDHDAFGPAEQTIVWSGIDISGRNNISFQGLFAAQSTYEAWEGTAFGFSHDDYVTVEYSIDGGTYQKLIDFRANDGARPGGADEINNQHKQLAEDTNFNGIGNGTVLTKAFNEFTKTIPGSGSTLSLRLRVYSNNSYNEEWAIDNFRLLATAANSAPVATAPSAPTVSEDAINVALANNIQVNDADGDDQTVTFTVTGGTVSLGTTGITFAGGGNGSANFTASGTLANINAALDAATFTPTPNLFGTNAGTISFVSNDGTANSNTASVTFDIIGVNDDPTFVGIINSITVVEDEYPAYLRDALSSGIFQDIDAGSNDISLTIATSQGALAVANPADYGVSQSGHNTATLILTGSVANIESFLNINTNAALILPNNLSGPNAIIITLTANDNGHTGVGGGNNVVVGTVNVNITPVNDAPTDILLDNNSVAENEPVGIVVGLFSAIDVDNGDTFTYTLVPGSGDGGNSAFSIEGNELRTAAVFDFDVQNSYSIRVRVTDSGGLVLELPFSISITDVNEAPTVVNPIPNQTATENITFNFQFAANTFNDIDVGDVLTYSAQLSGGGSLPAWLSFDPISRTFSGTPGNDDTGSIAIEVIANDGNGGAVSDSFELSIQGVNDAPVISAPLTISVFEDEPEALTGISFTDVDAGSADVLVTFEVGSGTLAASSANGVTVGGNSSSLTLTGRVDAINSFLANGELTYTTSLNNTEAVTLTIEIDDQGNTGSGGAESDNSTVSLVVTAVNDAPVNTVPGAQNVAQNETLTFSAGNGNQISVSDVDLGSNAIEITLTASNGLISLASTTGLNFTQGSGTNDGIMTFIGSLVDVNNALNGLTYTPTPGLVGSASLEITSNDQGFSGSGGAQTDTDVISIIINPINPVVTSVTSSTANGIFKIGDQLTISVNFSEAVTVTGGTPELTLFTGTDQVANYVSGSGTAVLEFEYIVAQGDFSTDLDYVSPEALDANGAEIQGLSSLDADLTLPLPGNPNSLSANKNFFVDGVIPITTTVSVPADGLYAIGQDLDFTVNFSEAVVLSGSPQISLTVGETSRQASYLAGTGSSSIVFRYTVLSGDLDLNGIVVGALSLSGGAIRDAAGNEANLILNNIGSTSQVLVDGVRPTVVSMSLDNTSLAVGETATLTLVLSERISGLEPADFSVDNGNLSGLTSSDGGLSWTAIVTPLSFVEDDSNVLSLNNTGYTDLAGNTGAGTSETANYEIDTQRPTALVNVTNPQLTLGETTLVTISFSEPVTEVSLDDFTVQNGTLSDLESLPGGDQWQATLTPDADVQAPNNLITLDNTGYQDLAGNAGTGVSNSNNYSVDTQLPSGYSVLILADRINGVNQNNFRFRLLDGEPGSDYSFSISSSAGGTPVTGTGEVTSSDQLISGIVVEDLPDGELTLTVTLTDESGNEGAPASDTVEKLLPATLTIRVLQDAAEGGDDGQFIIETDNTLAAITVLELEIGGTATPGEDYTPIPIGVLLLGNTNSVLIPVEVIDDLDVEGDETVSIRLVRTDNSLVTLGQPRQATLTITDNDAPRQLTITPDANQQKVYGDDDPTTFSYTASGFDPGNDETIIQGSLTRETGENAGTYSYTLGNLDAGPNYELVLNPEVFTITPATLSIEVDDLEKIYGAEDPDYSYTATGFQLNDTEAILTGTLARAPGENVGTYNFNLNTLSAGANYNLQLLSANPFQITPAQLRLIAENKQKIFGTANPALTFVYDGLVNGDTQIQTAPTLGTTATETSPAGNYSITLDGGSDPNYSITRVDGTLTIGQKTVTITAANQSKIYGAANPVLTFTYTNLLEGDTQIQIEPSISTEATTGSNVGTYEITLSGGSDPNYDFTLVNGTLSVTPAPLTITADDQSKVYGAANPVLTVEYDGLVNGDTQIQIEPSIATTATTSSSVGSYPITLSGGSDPNYTITRVNGNLGITPAPLTITADDKQKTFSQANPTLTFSYVGLVNGDTQVADEPSIATTATEASPVGSYLITLSGGSDPNYAISILNGMLTVIPSDITGITFDGASFTFDGTEKSIEIAGALPSGTSVAYTNNSRTDVGTQEVTATITGSNFTTLVLTADLTVTPADITGISFDDASFVFDGTTKSLAITGTLPVGASVVYTGNNRTDVGTQEVTATITGSNFTTLVLTADLTVTPADITSVTFEDASFVYEGTAKSLAITGTLPAGTSVAYANNSRTDVGTQVVTATISGSNYTELVLTADLEITPATITGITFEDDTFVYDGTAKSLAISGTLPAGANIAYTDNSRTDVGTQEATVTITGANFTTLVLTADLTVTPATVTGITFEDNSFVYDSTAKSLAITGTLPAGTSVAYANNSRTDVGTQEVTATITGSNFTTLVSTADLTVTPADITGISFDDASFVYDGTAKSLAINGTLPAGANVAYSNNSRTDVGTQVVTATISGSNYTELVLTADLEITPATITGITFEDDTFVYDGTAKSLAITGTLPVGASVVYTGNNRTDVGTQEVTATITGSNFTTLVLTADLTVTPADITSITFEDASFVYDGTAKSLAINGTLPAGANVAYTDNSRTDVGTQVVTATISGSNYTELVLTADLEITPATITGITFEDDTFVYDGTAKSLAITGTLPAGTTVSYTDNTHTNAGTYNIMANIEGGNNYNDLSLTANLTIHKAPQSIRFNSPGVLSRDAGTIALDVYASSDLPVNLSVDDAFIATVSGTDLMVHRLGTVRVSATQPGNANYEAAEPVYMDIKIANDASAKVPIRVHQAVSPNGDGINEFLMIEGIGDYPDNRVTIFDKSGRVLAEIEGYNNRDKVFTGQYVIDGTYYYYLDLLDDGTWKREKGFFVVKRSSGN
ncbi:T9SS type B sorting domain-containing protein [Sphingobacterium olei]|uniref:T9SS type B sorting domain-containing protein n=1 Tax=Sphingobacterium olei TaxID=2571155 RepID=A0A4U0P6G8_9SPHI|nr:MBG domain-containing protein [Sphingobacterium olei]TJZ63051.1 T9SS type B sorting domain-containing protein [Sphingobacterium olei]